MPGTRPSKAVTRTAIPGTAEVLQRIGSDLALATLDFLVLAGGHQFGTDFGVEHRFQHVVHCLIELARRNHPADQVLDQRLGHAAVDVVVRHLIADAIGRPAQRQLGEVTGASTMPPR